MCGRYALGIRAAFVRYQFEQQGVQVDNAPADEEARETYNFPPGAYGLVYRADVPDTGLRNENENDPHDDNAAVEPAIDQHDATGPNSFKYELKVMKWGLIPFWTKRSPGYGSMMRTINCRDDSLIENRGMWTTMKQRKRCIVVAQGFYEWLKKGLGGKEKIPHFVKRKDGQLMCLAGLWDCVRYEDSEDKLYTYSIITTDSNKQLNFLHDRMPVILNPGSDAWNLWLNPMQTKWTKDLQSILKPYEGDLECYQVNKDVGKVGNNSPDFIIPVDSKENKKNIANFFGNAKKIKEASDHVAEKEKEEDRATQDHESTEDNAPVPVPQSDYQDNRKRAHSSEPEEPAKAQKLTQETMKSPAKWSSPKKAVVTTKTRSATSNEGSTLKNSPAKKSEPGMQKITNFFVK